MISIYLFMKCSKLFLRAFERHGGSFNPGYVFCWEIDCSSLWASPAATSAAPSPSSSAVPTSSTTPPAASPTSETALLLRSRAVTTHVSILSTVEAAPSGFLWLRTVLAHMALLPAVEAAPTRFLRLRALFAHVTLLSAIEAPAPTTLAPSLSRGKAPPIPLIIATCISWF